LTTGDDMVLSLSGLTCSYGPVTAIHALRIGVRAHSVVAILGANGAGKSTTLKAISGLVRPSRGSVFFNGTDITGISAAKRVKLGIAHCPEGRRVFVGETVKENLVLGGHLASKKSIDSKIAEVLELFPALERRLDQVAGSLSGGEQQMLAIGRALVSSPKLLLLDEPSLGLAPIIIRRVFEALVQINKQGTAIVLVEQNVSSALKLASYAYVLREGRIGLEGTPDELTANEQVHGLYLGG
jgi:branched-chain amino acid transport system ATP-binding protein